MTAVGAFPAMRRGARKPGKELPLHSLGMCSSIVPARVRQVLSRYRCAGFTRPVLQTPEARSEPPLTQEDGVGGLLQKTVEVHGLGGHHGVLGLVQPW